MSNCLFCEGNKNPEDPAKIVEVPLYKVVNEQRQRLGNTLRTTYQYLPFKVLVPRCTKCAVAHSGVRKIWWLGMPAGLFALTIGWFVAIGIANTLSNSNILGFVGCFYPLLAIPALFVVTNKIAKRYLRSKETLPESHKNEIAEVKQKLADGYKLGKTPSGNR